MSLRIAYLCADPGVPVFGTKGASVHVQEIVRSWRARGARVHLYCARIGDHVPDDLRDLPVTHIPVPDGSLAGERERAQQRVAAHLADAALADGVDIVYERYSLFSRALSVVGAGVAGARIVRILEVNSPLIEEQARYRRLVDAPAAWATLRAQVDAADRVVAISPPVADWVCGHTAAGDRLRVVPNGVNVDRIRPSATSASRSGTAVVVFVGTLKPWHGIEILIEAAALACSSWQLRIIGDGPLRQSLREQATARGVPVDFRGAVAPDHIAGELNDAIVAVAPYPASDDHYFSPLKIYEYAAAGLPVVASDLGQVPRIVTHGETGLLVPPSDPAALAASIDALVLHPERAARLGRAGRARAVAEHSWTQALDRILDGLAADDLATAREDSEPETVGASHG
jgi:glycosyltransferase involved in cell wall biosynthesis